MSDCIFCKLASGEIPTEVIYEDKDIFVFSDATPEAPTHLLFIPKTHIASMAKITEENADIVAKIFVQIARIAKEKGLEKGYRVVSNCGKDGGQSVNHLHFHLLAGRSMQWPPG